MWMSQDTTRDLRVSSTIEELFVPPKRYRGSTKQSYIQFGSQIVQRKVGGERRIKRRKQKPPRLPAASKLLHSS